MTEFHERRGLTWCKLHRGWWTRESHADIHAGLLGIGALMMSIANQFGRQADGSGLVVNSKGKPLDVVSLAFRGRCPEAFVVEAIEALVEAETIEITHEGVIRFPNLRRWQEDPSTERKRRSAPSRRDSHAEIHAEKTRIEREIHASEDQRIRGSEDQKRIRSDPPNPPRGEPAFSLAPIAPEPTRPRQRKGPPKTKADRATWFLAEAEAAGRLADIDAVCAAFTTEHKRVRPRARPKPGPIERGLIAEHLLTSAPGYSVGDLVEAIRGCHADRWHVDAGKLELEYIVRDSAQVEKFRRKFEAAQDSPSGTTGGHGVRLDPVRLGYAEQLEMRNEQMRRDYEARQQPERGDRGADNVIDVGTRRGLGDGGCAA